MLDHANVGCGPDLPLCAGDGATNESEGAWRSTSQVYGVLALRFPAASSAVTVNVCEPPERLTREAVDEHAAGVPASRAHWNVAASLAVNAKAADCELVGFGGTTEKVTTGAVRSVTHVNVAGEGSRLPAWFFARTWKVHDFSAGVETDVGLVHAANAPVSSAHSNVAAESLDVKENVAELACVATPGVAVIIVSGSDVSTVQLWVAGDRSRLPAVSIATTRNVWAPAATVTVCGLVHAANAPPSSEHSKLPGSFDENVNAGMVELSIDGGIAVIVVSGGIPSVGPSMPPSTDPLHVADAVSAHMFCELHARPDGHAWFALHASRHGSMPGE